MKSIAYIGLWCLLLVGTACQKNTPTEANQSNKTAEFTPAIEKFGKNTPPPAAARGQQNFDEQLAASFNNEQLAELKNIETTFRQIKTAKDLANFYRQTVPSLIELLNKKVKKYDPEASSNENMVNKWRWIADYMPYVTVETVCADCEAEAYMVINPLRDKAEITAENDDNLFFEALATAYQLDNQPDKVVLKPNMTWIAKVGCDVCNADILGSGKHVKTLKVLEKAKATTVFLPEVEQLWIETMPNVANNYYYAKEEVLDELEQILTTVTLSNREKERLKNIRYLLSTNKTTQFDCQKGNCQFLAM
ncbi:MAG: hypothetical protein ACOVQA_12330 [Thermoflexibacteraceae bacterium]|jgi:hypothetical protein